MKPAFCSFIFNENGAIAVDWTLVGAAAVGMALTAVALIGGAAQQSGVQTSATMSGYEIETSFEEQPEVTALFISIERPAIGD